MITPEELRKLANAHLGETPPYVKHLYEACNALRYAADEIERLQAALKSHDARAETTKQTLRKRDAEGWASDLEDLQGWARDTWGKK